MSSRHRDFHRGPPARFPVGRRVISPAAASCSRPVLCHARLKTLSQRTKTNMSSQRHEQQVPRCPGSLERRRALPALGWARFLQLSLEGQVFAHFCTVLRRCGNSHPPGGAVIVEIPEERSYRRAPLPAFRHAVKSAVLRHSIPHFPGKRCKQRRTAGGMEPPLRVVAGIPAQLPTPVGKKYRNTPTLLPYLPGHLGRPGMVLL
eukprot:gene13878-biopygen9601